MNRVFFLICIIFLMTWISLGQKVPDFPQYPVKDRKIKSIKIDLTSHQLAPKYQIQLNDLDKNDINFAGQYILKELSCGLDCLQFVVINADNGTIFFPEILQNIKFNSKKIPAQKIVSFKRSSKLLVLNFLEDEGKNVSPYKFVKTYFEWNGFEFLKIKYLNVVNVSRVILPLFTSLVSQMETKVPLLLPPEIPDPKFLPKVIPMKEESSSLSFYSYILFTNENEYDLSIDISLGCKGRPNCNYGHLAGKKNSSNKLLGMNTIEFDSQIAQKIKLDKGVNGFYIPAPDNPKSLKGSQILWLDGKGNQYGVSLKRATKEEMIIIANSMINNYSN